MSVIVRGSVDILGVKRSDIFSVLLHESETIFTEFADGKAHLSSSYISCSSSRLSITELELARSLYSFGATLEKSQVRGHTVSLTIMHLPSISNIFSSEFLGKLVTNNLSVHLSISRRNSSTRRIFNIEDGVV